MNLTSIIFGLIILIGAVFLFVFLAVQIGRNFRIGEDFRRNLAERVDQLRLAKMLKARGIDLSAYLHTDSISEIEQNISSCQNCDVKNTCDQELKEEKHEEADLKFCPNDESLKNAAAQIAQKTN